MKTCELCGRSFNRQKYINTWAVLRHGVSFYVITCHFCESVKDSDEYKAQMDALLMRKIKDEGGIKTAQNGRNYVHTVGENQYIPRPSGGKL